MKVTIKRGITDCANVAVMGMDEALFINDLEIDIVYVVIPPTLIVNTLKTIRA